MIKKEKQLQWIKLYESVKEAAAYLDEGVAQKKEAGGKQLCLVLSGERLFALGSRCPHNSASLHKATCSAQEIVCPLHRYRFNLETGQEMSGHGCGPLETYPVKVNDEGVFVGIEKTRWVFKF